MAPRAARLVIPSRVPAQRALRDLRLIVLGAMLALPDVVPLRGAVSNLSAYRHRTVFKEVAPGVPVAHELELVNVFKNGRPSFVQTGRLIEIKWSDPVKTDTGGFMPPTS